MPLMQATRVCRSVALFCLDDLATTGAMLIVFCLDMIKEAIINVSRLVPAQTSLSWRPRLTVTRPAMLNFGFRLYLHFHVQHVLTRPSRTSAQGSQW